MTRSYQFDTIKRIMKKVFAVLIVGCVVCLALIGALSVVPHTHGSDFDHSTHQSCPIYQLSLHPMHVALQAGVVIVAAFFLFYIFFTQSLFPSTNLFLTTRLRSPPISS